MNRSRWPEMLLILTTIAVLTWTHQLGPSHHEPAAVDGIAIGMAREAVEEQLGKPWADLDGPYRADVWASYGSPANPTRVFYYCGRVRMVNGSTLEPSTRFEKRQGAQEILWRGPRVTLQEAYLPGLHCDGPPLTVHGIGLGWTPSEVESRIGPGGEEVNGYRTYSTAQGDLRVQYDRHGLTKILKGNQLEQDGRVLPRSDGCADHLGSNASDFGDMVALQTIGKLRDDPFDYEYSPQS